MERRKKKTLFFSEAQASWNIHPVSSERCVRADRSFRKVLCAHGDHLHAHAPTLVRTPCLQLLWPMHSQKKDKAIMDPSDVSQGSYPGVSMGGTWHSVRCLFWHRLPLVPQVYQSLHIPPFMCTALLPWIKGRTRSSGVSETALSLSLSLSLPPSLSLSKWQVNNSSRSALGLIPHAAQATHQYQGDSARRR